MANFLKTLIPLLIAMALLLGLASTPARAQYTFFDINFNDSRPTNLTYQGDAHFPSDSTNLRLNKNEINSTGRVLYSEPIIFWDDEGSKLYFDSTIKFIIRPDSSDNLPADGLVFFLAPVGSTGSAGGNFGVFGSSGRSAGVFAVEFDSFENDWDPNYRHVGIDIESRVSRNTTQVEVVGQEVSASIDYWPLTDMITVTVTAGSRVSEVSYVCDLSTILTKQVQVGISAATGGHHAFHDLISWNFFSVLAPKVLGSDGAGASARQFV